MDNQPKRTVKDSVFTNLFSEKKYVLQLYQALFPEDIDATEDDITIVTLENILVNAMYNDLGFTVRGKMIVLAEAQSTWSGNILVRMLMYLAKTYNEYTIENGLDLFGTKKAPRPKPKLFVIYTGDQAIKYDKISFADEFFSGDKDVDIVAKVITRGKKNDIVYQYITFTKVLNQQICRHGRTEKAITETIRICRDADVLREYLGSREKEVITMTRILFDEETIWKIHDKSTFEEGHAAGLSEGRAAATHEMLEKLRGLGVSDAVLRQAMQD